MLYTAIRNGIAATVTFIWAVVVLVGVIDEGRQTDPQVHVVFMSTMTLLLAADKFMGSDKHKEKVGERRDERSDDE